MHRERLARTTGLLYALNFVLGITAMVWTVQGHTVAAARMTLAGAIEYALVVVLIAWLFEDVGRGFSWTVAAIGLAGCTVGVAGALHLWGSATSALPVFGLYCIGLSALIGRSGLMPRLIGGLLAIGGICWLTYADLALARALQPYNMACGIVAEMIFTLWLIGPGIRHEKVALSA